MIGAVAGVLISNVASAGQASTIDLTAMKDGRCQLMGIVRPYLLFKSHGPCDSNPKTFSKIPPVKPGTFQFQPVAPYSCLRIPGSADSIMMVTPKCAFTK